MRLLLDTPVVLWWLADAPQLTPDHRALISDTRHVCFVSAATVWEISIKRGLGKLQIDEGYLVVLRSQGFLELAVSWEHCHRVNDLPALHRDPFDRLLIAQAQSDGLTLLSVDPEVLKYDVAAR